jgi:hypothetical protein
MNATLDGVLRKHLDAGKTPDEAAKAVLASREHRQLLLPLLVWRAHKVTRQETRAVERRVRKAGVASPDARRELIERGFILPDGRFVEWLYATADEHLARAGWQRDNARAIVADAELHEEAAKRITEAGVTCLADLEEAA